MSVKYEICLSRMGACMDEVVKSCECGNSHHEGVEELKGGWVCGESGLVPDYLDIKRAHS